MAEQPALNRFYVASYAANDRDFPIVAVRLDPRVAGYRVPEDLSPHPDSKRYPNHVFTGSQPSNGDERVTHIYEILPSPWVPFTRYDDDLGPIQGRRRSVKNEGQVASLAADKRVTYEAREGSAIVYTEIEEAWSIETDDDGNSLFPIRDRDFYDASRGPVQERRQLFVPTGEEAGSLENVNGVITQTSYEPYNEFLSVKIVQTYSVSGPQLIGKATDNDGQLVTVTTQRKAALDYIPPNPTATKTVEVSREDAESLVERVVDTPEVFDAQSFSIDRPDPIPQKFRVLVPTETEQETLAGTAEMPELDSGQLSKSQQQVSKFVKRISTTSRDQTVLPQTLSQKATNNDGQIVTVTETLQSGDTTDTPTALKTIQSEALGDGNFVVTKSEIPEVFEGKSLGLQKPDVTPQKFRAQIPSTSKETTVEGTVQDPIVLTGNEISKSEQQVTKFVKRVRTEERDPASTASLTGGKVYTSELGGGIADVVENYSASGDITVDLNTVSASSENLGDYKFVSTKVTLPAIPTLVGQEYDEFLDAVIPYTQTVVSTTLNSAPEELVAGSELSPRDVYKTVKRTIDKDRAKEIILNKSWQFGDVVNITLPDQLLSVKSVETISRGGDYIRSEFESQLGSSVIVENGGTYTVVADLVYDIEQGYNGPVESTRFVFFLDRNNATRSSVVEKIDLIAGYSDSNKVRIWPQYKPKGHLVTISAGTVQTEGRVVITGISGEDNSTENSSSPLKTTLASSVRTSTTPIPPTLHGRLEITRKEITINALTQEEEENITFPPPIIPAITIADSSAIDENSATSNSVDDKIYLEETTPSVFLAGNYLISIQTEPYRFDLVKVSANVVHVKEQYVIDPNYYDPN